MPNGVLEVKVIKAEGLRGSKRAVLSRKKCPYVQVEVGQKLQRTRLLTKDASNHADVPAGGEEEEHHQNCVWDETLVFRNIPESMNYAVLHVFHDHTFHDECLGRVTLPLAEVKKVGANDATYPVIYEDKPCGTITIGMRFSSLTDHEGEYALRPPSPVHTDWRQCWACKGPVHKECSYCAHCGVLEPSGKKERLDRVNSEQLQSAKDDTATRDHRKGGFGIAAAAVAGGEILSKLIS
eukprot:jgi/Chlat1/4229/Chrsp27S04312